ncbi:MAG: EAL domain-containing protein [Leptospiraceae bacterium]|nr:EAL domain-containing protein [Leptospiraceae bacterium]MCP5493292.1 EAL domain-containing protein [Leptospiraceae bacterium]
MKNILVIEDDIATGMYIKAILEHLGYSVASVLESGEDAIDYVSKSRPDLILSDIVLKGEMDGVQVAQIIRSQYNIPVIFLTAMSEDDIISQAIQTEPFGYILKPVEKRELLITIEMAFYRHNLEKKLIESEDRYVTTLKSISDGVIVTDIHCIVTFINKNAEELIGWTNNTAIGKVIWDVLKIKYKDKTTKEVIYPIFESKKYIFEQDIIVKSKSNHLNYIDISISPIRNKDNTLKGIVILIKNINERIHKFKKALEKEKILEKIISEAPIGIYITDKEGLFKFSEGELFKQENVLKDKSSIYKTFKDSPELLDNVKESFSGKTVSNIVTHNNKIYSSWTSPLIEQENTIDKILGILIQTNEIESKKRLYKQISKLRTTLDNVSQGIAFIKGQNVSKINKKLKEILFYSNQDLKNVTIEDVFPSILDYQQIQEKVKTSFLSKGTFHSKLKLKRKDGVYVWCELTGISMDYTNPFYNTIWIIEDVHEKNQIEDELKNIERRLSLVVSNAPIILCSIDPKGFLTYGVGKGFEGLKIKTEKLPGKSIFDIVGGNVKNQEIIRRALTGEVLKSLIDFDGKFFETWFTPQKNQDGEIINVIAVGVDNTEQKRYEKELLESLKELQFQKFALDQHSIVAITGRDGKITYINEKFMEISKYSKEELIGNDHRIINSGYHSKDFFKNMWDTILSGKIWKGEVKNKTKDNQYYWVETTIIPYTDSGGKVTNFVSIRTDITERKNNEAHLKESEERFSLAVRGASDGIWDWNIKTDELYLSPRYSEILGYEPDEIGKNLEDLFKLVHPEDLTQLRNELQYHLKKMVDHFEFEHRIRHKNGTYHWVLNRGIAVFDAENNPVRMVGSQSDITNRKYAEESLFKQAFHDHLTGLPNRVLFMNYIQRAIYTMHQKDNYKFAVIYLELDRYKIVTDSLGHFTGDRLLINASKRLKNCLNPNDYLARLDGEDFAILLDDIQSVENAIDVVNRIKNELIVPFVIKDQDVFTGAVFGIVMSSPENEIPENLIRDADTSMFMAKTQSKNFVVFDREMHKTLSIKLKMETDLRKALERKELTVHYQPIIDIQKNVLSGYEALARWKHPEEGMISPVHFIPIAEETGLIVSLGDFVLETSIMQIKEWEQKYHANIFMSVNVSVKQLILPDFLSKIQKLISKYDIVPGQLKLEITESAVLERDIDLTDVLTKLKDMNIYLLIDDFGTGYSSLSRLHSLPFDIIKIDHSFVREMTTNNNNFNVIRTINSLAKNLNMDVTAEGIETKEQLEKIKNLGCHYGQGFYFSRPLDAIQSERYLVNNIEIGLRPASTDLL